MEIVPRHLWGSVSRCFRILYFCVYLITPKRKLRSISANLLFPMVYFLLSLDRILRFLRCSSHTCHNFAPGFGVSRRREGCQSKVGGDRRIRFLSLAILPPDWFIGTIRSSCKRLVRFALPSSSIQNKKTHSPLNIRAGLAKWSNRIKNKGIRSRSTEKYTAMTREYLNGS